MNELNNSGVDPEIKNIVTGTVNSGRQGLIIKTTSILSSNADEDDNNYAL